MAAGDGWVLVEVASGGFLLCAPGRPDRWCRTRREAEQLFVQLQDEDARRQAYNAGRQAYAAAAPPRYPQLVRDERGGWWVVADERLRCWYEEKPPAEGMWRMLQDGGSLAVKARRLMQQLQKRTSEDTVRPVATERQRQAAQHEAAMAGVLARPAYTRPAPEDNRYKACFFVASSTSKRLEYKVSYDLAQRCWVCSCQGYINRGTCKHVAKHDLEPTRYGLREEARQKEAAGKAAAEVEVVAKVRGPFTAQPVPPLDFGPGLPPPVSQETAARMRDLIRRGQLPGAPAPATPAARPRRRLAAPDEEV